MATPSSSQHRSHVGHSHHHHHHHDNSYLTSTNKNDAGVRVTRLGLYVNMAMAVGKGIGGYYFNSQALVADAFHALTDLVSDFMTLATISVALKPPTDKYPNGFGKVESMGSLMVSGLLLTGGLLMCQHAGMSIFNEFFADSSHSILSWPSSFGGPDGAHSHGHSHSHTIPNINAAWLAAGSIVVKEYLYRITMKVAKERKSSVLASNAVHHRVDSLTSIVALLTIAGSHVLPGASWLDPVGGLIVSAMVIQAGLANTLSAVYELCDKGIDEGVQRSVQRAANKALADLREPEVRGVQGVKAGQNYLVDIEIAIPSYWTLEKMQKVEDEVRERVGGKVRGVRRVKIRFVSKDREEADFVEEFIGADVSPRSSPEPEPEEEHAHSNHDHSHGSGTSTGHETSEKTQRRR